MFIKKIELNNFRNYIHLDMDFHKKVNILLGKNAQGKTNLVEAIYFTSIGKSFRTNKDNEMIGFDGEFARVKIIAEKNEEPLELELLIKKEGKEVKKEGYKLSKTSEMLDNIYIVVFSPEDLRIVKDEPEKRRKFIDRELCQLKPVYYNNLSRYKKILQQRNALLKGKEIKEDILKVWDISICEVGSEIIRQRREFIEKINIISKEIHKEITNNKEILDIIYESNIEYVENIEKQKDFYLKKLEKNWKNDIYKGNTSVGPHKDDLKLIVNGIDIRNYGSQGQQRTAALSLKLAEVKLIEEEKREKPILLLDDVLSELDSTRQKYLINSLKDLQIFITTTEISKFLEESLSEKNIYIVKEGNVNKR
ncbi:MAG: DNA replication/repair protein RecF [Peptostreptococcaceae bacterium]|nr:DNA replication/repair protein RecF [Peptostreptococcaceae bacterium]